MKHFCFLFKMFSNASQATQPCSFFMVYAFLVENITFSSTRFSFCSSVKQAVNIQVVFTSCAFSSLTHFYFLPSISQFIFFIPLVFILIHRIKSHFSISDGTNVHTFARKLFTVNYKPSPIIQAYVLLR
jgi:hypothetical protein